MTRQPIADGKTRAGKETDPNKVKSHRLKRKTPTSEQVFEKTYWRRRKALKALASR
ncbi:MAG: hypothetical protein OXF46_10605 [Rhodobacteraceae bacterium]|nr:hypothetical protein [Paracoccaceae bacterium]